MKKIMRKIKNWLINKLGGYTKEETNIWRWRNKGGVEDLKKARVYLDWLIQSADKE